MHAVYAEIACEEIASDVHSVYSVILEWRIVHEEHLQLIANNSILLRFDI